MARQRRWWLWLAASLAGVAMLVIFAAGVLSFWEAWAKHRFAVAQRQRTSFASGPLRYPEWLLPYLGSLPPPSALGMNGLRFVAKPELEDVTYAAAFRSDTRGLSASITLTIVHERPGSKATGTRYACLLSPSSYRSMTGSIDERTQGFDGSNETGTDGTSLGFERIRGSRIASGGGNRIEPYRALGEIVLARLREACPRAPLPEIGDDWYRRSTFE